MVNNLIYSDFNGRLKLIKLQEFVDKRGRLYTINNVTEDVIGWASVQTNICYNNPNVFRGIHYQPNMSRALLSINGIIDVIILDCEKKSKDFGKHTQLRVLPGEILVGSGFGWGFYSDRDASVIYLCSTPYDKSIHYKINFNSIGAKLENNVIISVEDLNALSFSEFEEKYA